MTKKTDNTNHIAIIGMAGRFPGAGSIPEFWDNLCQGVESISFFSEAEVRAAGVHEEWLQDPHYVRAGGVVEGMELFDSNFFDISPREALYMDPQHRLFLECAWEALENSGHNPEHDAGTVSVYAGSRISEYLLNKQKPVDLVGLGTDSFNSNWRRLLSNDKDLLCTMVSYKLNLKGPSINVQTACSTSLVAVHLACQSLIHGECNMALAGGSCLRVLPTAGYPYMDGIVQSSDGHTRTFDASASGTMFTSGVGIVVLKRLDHALQDGDHIHAIIRGTAINNDGNASKAAFAAPSVEGQAAAIKAALDVSGVDADSIGYVEAHGTGTRIGDPIEISALTHAYRRHTNRNGYCAIGSVKPNIGHTVQAAGVISLIKTALMLEHGQLVPSINYITPNQEIDFPNSPFYVNTELKPWLTDEIPRDHVTLMEKPHVQVLAGKLQLILDNVAREINAS